MSKFLDIGTPDRTLSADIRNKRVILRDLYRTLGDEILYLDEAQKGVDALEALSDKFSPDMFARLQASAEEPVIRFAQRIVETKKAIREIEEYLNIRTDSFESLAVR